MTDDLRPDELSLPLVEERLTVGKVENRTGVVKVSTQVETREAVVREALRSENVRIERVEIGREVSDIPKIRQEGEVVIYPVVEEILVVEKRLVLKEELRISYEITTQEVDRSVTLRTVHADVERTPAEPAPPLLTPSRTGS